MPKYGGQSQIRFGVHFDTDKASIQDVKKSLQELQHLNIGNFKGAKEDLVAIKKAATDVDEALTNAFNAPLNSVNVQRFNQEISKTGHTISSLQSDFAKAGISGQQAFNQLATSILTSNVQLKQTHSLINQMGTTMMNTVKWGIASSIFNNITQSVSQAFDYVKALDSALTDIRIVTGDSRDQMAKFADEANRAAQSLGRSTMEYSKAALTFYQQGLSDQDVQARTEATLKAQNITGAGSQMADYLTAVWNGYKVANEEAELYVDKLAAVADSSASNMSQLAIAMSKVASTANMLGVPVDSLNAQIATIVATTRQAPESVGNALKTIYARINDIATGADDAEISLGNYTSKMAELGVNVLDSNGKLRDTGDVIEQIGGKWQTLSREQQIYLARTMAGQRQYNNLLALFENWGRYTDLVNVSMDAQGTTMEKNSRYMESLEAHLNQLGAASERLKSSLVDSDSFKGLIDVGTGLTTAFANFIESIGGGGNAILTLGGIVTSVFSGTISREISNFITNMKAGRENVLLLQQDIQQTKNFGMLQGFGTQAIQSIVKVKEQMQQYYHVLSAEQINEFQAAARELGDLKTKQQYYEDLIKIIEKYDTINSGENNRRDLAQEKLKNAQGAGNLLAQMTYENMDTNKIQAIVAKIKGQLQFEGVWDALPEGYTQAMNQLVQKIQTDGNLTEQEFQKIQTAAAGALSTAQEGFRRSGQDVTELRSKANGFGREADIVNQKIKSMIDQAQQMSKIQTFTKMVGGIAQISSGIKSLTNIVKIAEDESLSGGEKAFQIISALSMGVGMLYSGFQSMAPALLNIFGSIQIGAKGATISQIAATAATDGWSAALKGASISASSLWKALWPIALIGATIAGIAIAVKILSDAWNADAIAAKNAAKGAEEAKQAYEEAKESLNNLKSSLDSLNDSYDNIKNLKEGTQEWRDAVRQVNDQVLELIKNYPELANHVNNVNGMLELTEQGQEKAIQLQEERVDAAQRASIAANQNSRQATINSKATDLGRKNAITEYDGQGGTYTRSLNKEAVQAVVQSVGDLRNSFAQQGKLYDQSGKYTQEFINAIAENSGQARDLVSQLISDEAGMKELQNAILQDIAATKLETETLVQQNLKNQEWYKGLSEEQQKVAVNIGSKNYQAQLDNATDDWLNYLTKSLWRTDKGQDISYKGTSGQDVLNAMSQIYGQNLSWDTNSIQGSGKERTFHFIDEAGESKSWGADFVASTMAAKEALQKLGTSSQTTAKMLGDLAQMEKQDNNPETSNQLNAKAMRQLLAGEDFSNLTEGQVNSLDAYSDQMTKFFEQYAEAAGYVGEDAAQQFKNAFLEKQKETQTQFENLLKDQSTFVQDAFGKIDTDQLTLTAQKSLVESLRGAFAEGGKQGLDSLTSFYDKVNDFDALEKLNQDIDFNTISAEELEDQLRNAGVATGLTTEELQAYIEAQKRAAGATAEATPEEAYKSIHDIIDGIKRGDSITSQQAQTLRNAGIDVDNYFEKWADGSLKLRTSAQDFYEYANSISLDPLKEELNSLTELTAKQNYFEQNSQYSASNQGNFNDFSQNAKSYSGGGLEFLNTQLLRDQIEFLSTVNDLTEDEKILLAQVTSGEVDATTKTKELAQAVAHHEPAWRANSAAIEDNVERINELQQELYNTQLDRPLDPDVDEQKWEDLSDYLHEYADQLDDVDDHLKDDKQAAEDLAEQMLRYDHALEEVADKYDDWMAALQSGTIQEQAEAGAQLSNVYSDLLGLPFDNLLSPAFTQSTQNLQDMKLAAQGDEQAYNRLMEAARQDIAAQVNLNDEDFQNKFNNLMMQTYNKDLGTFEAGASLNDEAFLASLTQMVNAAGMSAQQATNYLASMGVDAEVVENKSQGQEIKTITDIIPQVTSEPDTLDWFTFGPGGIPIEAHIPVNVPGINYTTHPHQVSDTKQNVAHSLKVTSAHKSSGGGFKFKNATHGSGAGKSSGGKGGGGGGGSKPKAPTKAKTTKLTTKTQQKQQIDNPYEQVQKSYSRQEQQLKRLDKIERNLDGKDRLENLEKQEDVLKQQAKTLQEYLDISKSTVEGSTGYFRDLILKDKAFTTNEKGKRDTNLFDEDGQFKNLEGDDGLRQRSMRAYNNAVKKYDAELNKVQQQYNNWINNVYNKMSGQQQQAAKEEKTKWDDRLKTAQDKHKQLIKTEEQSYKKREELIKDYQDNLKKDLEKYEQYVEKMQAIVENGIEQTTYKLKLSLDVGDAERDYLDFENKVIKKLNKDDILGNAQANFKKLTSYLNSGEIANGSQVINNIQKRIDDIQKANGGYSLSLGISREEWDNLKPEDQEALIASTFGQLQKELEEAKNTQMKNLEAIQDQIDEIKEAYLDAIDDVNDKMDNQIEQYERVNDLIDHNIKMTQLLYGDKGYETLNKYYSLQEENNKKELDSLVQQQKYWQNRMNNEVVGSEAWKKFKENLDDVTDKLNDKVVEMMENAAKIFENRVSAAVDNINNRMTGGLGLDYVDEQWDYMSDYDDYFLDTFNTKTGIDQVTRAYQDALADSAGNPKQYQRINNLMQDQLKILKEKDKLTEYDLDRAKSLLEVEKARMALEDARNNKTKMRLRRDSQGNYTYQYVADEEKLGDLQDALADAQNNLYNQDKQHYKQNLNKLYDTYKDYIQKMKQLTEEYNATQDEEERARIQKRIDLLKESTSKMMEGLTDDNKYNLQYLTQSFADGMGIDLSKYSPEEQMELLKENVPFVAGEVQKLNDKIVAEGGLLPATRDYVKELNSAVVQYDQDVKDILAQTENSVEKITAVVDENGNLYDNNITSAERLIEANDKLIKSCEDELDSMQDMLNLLDQYVNGVINYQKLIAEIQNAQNTGYEYKGSDLKVDDEAIQSNNIDTTIGHDVEVSGETKQDRAAAAQTTIKTTDYSKFMQDQMGIAWTDNQIKESTKSAFNTILDNIINSNFDPTVITNAVQQMTNDAGLSKILNTMGQNAYNMVQNTTNSDLSEQYVTINANFPDATSSAEIEQALRNLIAMAAMSASSKKG